MYQKQRPLTTFFRNEPCEEKTAGGGGGYFVCKAPPAGESITPQNFSIVTPHTESYPVSNILRLENQAAEEKREEGVGKKEKTRPRIVRSSRNHPSRRPLNNVTKSRKKTWQGRLTGTVGMCKLGYLMPQNGFCSHYSGSAERIPRGRRKKSYGF